MSYKRPRSTYEADANAPYAVFGTPLPSEADGRDDGSYLPLWKQDVRDERGRKRLHGAFTGGWSAGYFNTVGSKEGWTPSTFVSSRNNRHKNDDAAQPVNRAEDYMDEEDLADAAEAQKLQTSQAFAGLGSSTEDEVRSGGLMQLFASGGDTMGRKLLRKMGWKDGQGIGPKIRRTARLDLGKGSNSTGQESHFFAPENAPMIRFVRKADRKGLGHSGEAKLSNASRQNDTPNDVECNEPQTYQWDKVSLLTAARPKVRTDKGGIGVGILNDDGSDEEDPYEIGPKIRYNRVIGGDKKKKPARKLAAAVNPALGKTPVYVPKIARAGTCFLRCHDGRLPLSGFVLSKVTDDLASLFSTYAPPAIPPGWKSARDRSGESAKSAHMSTADAAKASTHDPRSRAALLGEAPLPGKSVFDFLSPSVRDRLVAASGKKDLPAARGEVPKGYARTEEERQKALRDQIPRLDKDTAIAAMSRSLGGPYADAEVKRSRYKTYLEWQADVIHEPPAKFKGMTDDDYLKEMTEFHNCANIFKPMTGFMASRFTTAKTKPSLSNDGSSAQTPESSVERRVADTAEEAAKVGMFGTMTRLVDDFFPTRLLCKRFNVKAPAHSLPDREPDNGGKDSASSKPLSTQNDSAEMAWSATISTTNAGSGGNGVASDNDRDSHTVSDALAPVYEVMAEVNPERNEAVEANTANADVLRAIFGDSDSD